MNRKVARLTLSPNEEAKLIREEHERRRKLRIQQVREQERYIAFQIRREVQRRRERELENLAQELRMDWEQQHDEKLQALQNVYQQSIELLGMGHRSAKENEPDLEAIAQKKEENNSRAEERYREALKDLKTQQQKEQEEENRLILTRKSVIELEKKRSAKIASLPVLPPHPVLQSFDIKGQPLQQMQPSLNLKRHVVQTSDTPQPSLNLRGPVVQTSDTGQPSLDLMRNVVQTSDTTQPSLNLRRNVVQKSYTAQPSLNLRRHVVQKSDTAALSSTQYNMPETVVSREADTCQPDAWELAEQELQRLLELGKEEGREKEQQREKARLRGNFALMREHLNQERDRLLANLEHLQQTDLLRRRNQVPQVPAQVFQPLYKRQELREECQRDMEFAFEDMYTGERRVKGDLMLQLVPEPLPEVSTSGQEDQDLDLTLDEHLPSDPWPAPGPEEDPLESETQGAEPSRPAGGAPRQALRKLLDRIRSQRDQWSAEEAPAKDSSMDTGPLAGEESEPERVAATAPQRPEDSPTPHGFETTGESVVAGNLLPPEELTEKIHVSEAERKAREEQLEEEKQRQIVLLQELAEQKTSLEAMLLQAQQERKQLQEAVTQEQGPPDGLALEGRTSFGRWDPDAKPPTTSDEDDHARRIREYQQQLLERNRIHQKSVTVARRSLEEYQRALTLRHHMTTSSMLPSAGLRGLVAPQPLSVAGGVPLYSGPSGTAATSSRNAIDLPTRENAAMLEQTGQGSNIQPHRGMETSPVRLESPPESMKVSGAVAVARPRNPVPEGVTHHLVQIQGPSYTSHQSTARAPLPPCSECTPSMRPQASAKPGTFLPGRAHPGGPFSAEEVERQRRELQESQRWVQEQREVLEKQEEEAGELRRRQKDALQALLQADEAQSEDMAETRLRLLSSLLMAIEESNGNTSPPLQANQIQDRHVQVPPLAHYPHGRTEAPQLHLPRPPKPPLARAPPGLMELLMSEQHELSVIQEVETPANASLVPGQEESGVWLPRMASSRPLEQYTPDTTEGAPPGGSEVFSAGERSPDGGGSGTVSSTSKLSWRERLMLEAGASPKPGPARPGGSDGSSGSSLSVSGAGGHPNAPPFRPPTQSQPYPVTHPLATRPFEVDCLSSTTISSGSYATTDPEHPHHSYATTDPEHPHHSYATTDPEPPHRSYATADPEHPHHSYATTDPEHPQHCYATTDPEHPHHSYATADPEYPQLSSTRTDCSVLLTRLGVGEGESPSSSHSSSYRQLLTSAYLPGHSSPYREPLSSTASHGHSSPYREPLSSAASLGHSTSYRQLLSSTASPDHSASYRQLLSSAASPSSEALQHDSSIQRIIDKYTRELNVSLNMTGTVVDDVTVGPRAARCPAAWEEPYSGESEATERAMMSGACSNPALSPTDPGGHRHRRDHQVNRILDRLSRQSSLTLAQGQDSSFMPLIGQPADESSYFDLDQRGSSMDRLIGQPSDQSSSVGGVLDTSSSAGRLIGPLSGQSTSVTVDQRSDSNLSRVIGRLSSQSSGQWTSGGQDFFASQLIGQLGGEEGLLPGGLEERLYEGRDESEMRPLAGELDDSAVDKSEVLPADPDESSGHRTGMPPLNLDESSGHRSGMMPLEMDDSSGHRSGMMPLEIDDSSGHRSGMMPLEIDDSSGHRSGMMSLEIDDSSGHRSGMMPLEMDDSSGHRSGMMPLEMDESSGHRSGMMSLEIDDSSGHRSGMLPLDLDESSGHRSGMLPLEGELDDSSVPGNGRSGFEPQYAAAPATAISEDPGASARTGEPSGPVEEPDVQPQSSAVPQVDLHAASAAPREPETDSDSSGVDLGTDSFRPPPTEVTQNETVDPSMIFHLPDWEEPSSLEESNQSSARQPDSSNQSEEFTEREGESQRSSSPDSSPEHLRGADWLSQSQSQSGLQESLCQLSTSHSHPHHSVLVVSPTAQEAGLAALSLSAHPHGGEVPNLDLPSGGEGGGGRSGQQGVPAEVGGAGGAGDRTPGDRSTTTVPIWDSIVSGHQREKGILEESQLTLVSLTDTTLTDQDVTVSEEAGAQEAPVSEEEEEEEREEDSKEKPLKEPAVLNQLPEEDACLKQEKPSHAVLLLGFPSSPSVSLQQAFQERRRALLQRSHHRVQRIRASRTQSDGALTTRGNQSATSTSNRGHTQQRTQSAKSTTDRGHSQQRIQSAMSTTDGGHSQQRIQSPMSTTDRGQTQQRTQSAMSTTDRGQTQQRTQSAMSTTDRGQAQQRTQSAMSTTDRGQTQQRTQSVMSATDRGQTQHRVQPPPLAVRDTQLKKVGQVVICTPEQRKLDKMEMQLRTQRLYSRLEEVKLQKEIQSRQEAYTKNREKAKEFHKKTLQKLRAKHIPR